DGAWRVSRAPSTQSQRAGRCLSRWVRRPAIVFLSRAAAHQRAPVRAHARRELSGSYVAAPEERAPARLAAIGGTDRARIHGRAESQPKMNASVSVADLRQRFPDDFVWGVATSAFQIEGAARADGKGPSIWDDFCRVPGAIADGSSGERACEHYRRWAEDLALIDSLGVNSYRFSVS